MGTHDGAADFMEASFLDRSAVSGSMPAVCTFKHMQAPTDHLDICVCQRDRRVLVDQTQS